MSYSTNIKEVHFELEKISKVSDIEEKWSVLSNQIQSPSFIHDYRWFTSYLDSYKNTKKNIYLVLFYHNEDLVAIYPLEYVQHKQFGIKFKAWQIFWHNDMSVNDFIFSAAKHPESMSLLIDFLRSLKRLPWSLLILQNISGSSNISQATIRNHLPLDITFHHHDSKYLISKSTYEESMSGVSSKFKRNNHRKLRKLEKTGKVSYKLFHHHLNLKLHSIYS